MNISTNMSVHDRLGSQTEPGGSLCMEGHTCPQFNELHKLLDVSSTYNCVIYRIPEHENVIWRIRFSVSKPFFTPVSVYSRVMRDASLRGVYIVTYHRVHPYSTADYLAVVALSHPTDEARRV